MISKLNIAGYNWKYAVGYDESQDKDCEIVNEPFLLLLPLYQHYVEEAGKDNCHHSLANCSEEVEDQLYVLEEDWGNHHYYIQGYCYYDVLSVGPFDSHHSVVEGVVLRIIRLLSPFICF